MGLQDIMAPVALVRGQTCVFGHRSQKGGNRAAADCMGIAAIGQQQRREGGREVPRAGRDRLVLGLPSWDVPAGKRSSSIFQIPSSEGTGTELLIAGEEVCIISSRASGWCHLLNALLPVCPSPRLDLLFSTQLLSPPQPFLLFYFGRTW